MYSKNLEVINFINKFLSELRVNEYSSDHEVSAELCRTNCSKIIQHIFKSINIDFPQGKAFEVFKELKDSKGFEVFNEIEKLSAGDVIIWRKSEVPAKGSTGHISICMEVLKDGWVRVFDATKTLHDNDSRQGPGVGLGDIKLIIENGVAKGFVWSSEKKKTKYCEVLFARAIQNR
jgi:hypothetical protein